MGLYWNIICLKSLWKHMHKYVENKLFMLSSLQVVTLRPKRTYIFQLKSRNYFSQRNYAKFEFCFFNMANCFLAFVVNKVSKDLYFRRSSKKLKCFLCVKPTGGLLHNLCTVYVNFVSLMYRNIASYYLQ